MFPTFFDQAPSLQVLLPLLFSLVIALGFEFVNGFHDTANAVAMVIYTRSLKPLPAVLLAGVMNFVGVMVAGVTVAYSIVNLFPADVLARLGQGGDGFAMVFAVLVAAIAWNLGTWYFGIPASSSHTMIGAILGVALANAVASGASLSTGVQWDKALTVLKGLFFSPLFGFGVAGLALLLLKAVVKNRELYAETSKDGVPPPWIRFLLVLSCGGVAYAHGSNDGQKGMGLVMLILIGLVPASFALDLATPQARIASVAGACQETAATFPPADPSLTLASAQASLEASLIEHKARPDFVRALPVVMLSISGDLQGKTSLLAVPAEKRIDLRTRCMVVVRAVKELKTEIPASSQVACQQLHATLEPFTKYVLDWVKLAVALALGIGTTIGWKRVVVTVGEKIGKSQLTYAQGLVSASVTAGTILLADKFGLPVSTTHILSSGVAGTMVSNGSGVQRKTLVTIAMAWVLTLPVCISLSFALFFLFRLVPH